jgi:DNA-binding transcriptional LysR family regulator
MSRALARLRRVTGDPLLVKAGWGLVPTPRAVELREQVRQLVQDADAVLRPVERPALKWLSRTFTIRTSEGFVENFGPALLARIGEEAPGIRLRFMQKLDKDSTLLRDGMVDLETGVVGNSMGPEVGAQGLFRDRFVGGFSTAVALARGTLSPPCPNVTRAFSAAGCSRFPCPSVSPRSWCPSSGTQEWTATRFMAGCVAVCGRSAWSGALKHCSFRQVPRIRTPPGEGPSGLIYSC